MKIYANRIPEDGLELQASYDPAVLQMDRADVHVDGPVQLHGRATLEAKELFVSAELDYRLALTCSRCLEPVTTEGSKSLLLHFDTTQQLVVDITDDVRQEVMLDYPLRVLCRPACRGLCAVCGANLNESLCAHHERST